MRLNVGWQAGFVLVNEQERHSGVFFGIGFGSLDIEFFFFLLYEFFLFIDLVLVFLNAREKHFFSDDLGHLLSADLLHNFGSPVLRFLEVWLGLVFGD